MKKSKSIDDLLEEMHNAISDLENEQKIMENLEELQSRSEKIIKKNKQAVLGFVKQILKETIKKNSALANFLKLKPVMPHEKFSSYEDALASIINEILSGNIHDANNEFSIWDYNKALQLWKKIHVDLDEMLSKCFLVRAKFERTKGDEQKNYGSIIFY